MSDEPLAPEQLEHLTENPPAFETEEQGHVTDVEIEPPRLISFPNADPTKEVWHDLETGAEYTYTVARDADTAKIRIREFEERMDEIDIDPEQDPEAEEYNGLCDEIERLKARFGIA